MFGNLLDYIKVVRNGETPSRHPDDHWLDKLRGLFRSKCAGTSKTAPVAKAGSGDFEARFAKFEESSSKRLAKVESLLRNNQVHMVMNEVKGKEIMRSGVECSAMSI